VITDSGLGGLLICAGLESRLRPAQVPARLVYVNAWPDARYGYNDLADVPARAAVFDRALTAMTAFSPDLILIACNTLSVVYESTAFSERPAAPVKGILDAGADLFHEALTRDPDAVLALFGTRTTVGSGEYVRRLARRGTAGRRVISEPCHGLAAVIDKDPDSPDIPGLVDACAGRAAPRLPAGAPVYAGLACTHYAYIAETFRTALRRRTGGEVRILDPGERLVEGLTSDARSPMSESPESSVDVEVVSKVELAEAQRRAVARRLEPLSPATARALVAYTHVPELF
jgi:glutamate racemase